MVKLKSILFENGQNQILDVFDKPKFFQIEVYSPTTLDKITISFDAGDCGHCGVWTGDYEMGVEWGLWVGVRTQGTEN